MAEYSVVLFRSTAHAIRAEKVLERGGLQVKMIPTPRHLSSDCGIALQFDQALLGQVDSTLRKNNVPTNGIHAV